MAAPSTQTPRSKPVLFLFLGIVAFTLTFGIVALIRDPTGSRSDAKSLLVYCATSLKMPLEQIAADYQRDTGQRVELSFGDSSTLLDTIKAAKRGDLYLPADESHIRLARDEKLVAGVFPLPELLAPTAVAVLNCTSQPESARRFAEYLVAPDKGLKRFKAVGFPISPARP